MIKNFEPRLYQETILSTCVEKNTLVVLPTGLGKTNIFLMLAAHRLKLYPQSKILFIGPTRPLIDQYFSVFQKHFEIDEEKMAVFTGYVKPDKRAELWKTSQIIFSTPQGLENDIINGRIDLSSVSLLGFDEAHRAVGDYAYVWVAQQYQKIAQYPRIIGLTASPGSDLAKIEEVCKSLFIEDIEVRTDKDSDVAQYVQEVEIDWVKVTLPTAFDSILRYLKTFLKDRMGKLKDWGVLHRKEEDFKFVSKTDLLQLQAQLRGRATSGGKDFIAWRAISVLAEIMKIQHGVELLETQGITATHTYLQKLQKDSATTSTKAVKNIVADINFRSALITTEKLFNEKIQHPKIIELKKIVGGVVQDPSAKAMVFNQYRDNALDIVSELNTVKGVKAVLFVGQTKKGDTGLSQKDQKAILEKFRAGEYNVLVATSVGEEGIDIINVGTVIFFEPIPSAIRTIQRRGRTGRHEKGKVIVLMALNTRDVGYRWSAHHKEKRMYRTLETIKKKLGFTFGAKTSMHRPLAVSTEKKVKVFVDHREKGSKVIKELIDRGAELKLEAITHADYLLSSQVGVEYKTQEDFVNSLIDGRLLEQVAALKKTFARPLVIVEGDGNLFSIRNVHPNAIRGMLATIAISFGVPLLFTGSSAETASLLYIIAKREQQENGKEFTHHQEKKEMSVSDMQEYIVSSFPGVGSGLAKPLLRHFGSVKAIVAASEEELQKVEKIGKVKAQKIREVLDGEYKV